MHTIVIIASKLSQELESLERVYPVLVCKTQAEALQALRYEPVLIVVSMDFPIPNTSFDHLVHIIRLEDPFVSILIAVQGNQATVHQLPHFISLLKAGAHFLQFPQSKEGLHLAIGYAIEDTLKARQATQFTLKKREEPLWKKSVQVYLSVQNNRHSQGLPLSQDELKQLFPPSSHPPELKLPILKSFTLLTIDDEDEVREVIKQSFKPYFTVLDAPNGASGLDILNRYPVDVVFLDILMPGVQGDELVGTLKKVSPDTDVVMVTGNTDIDSVSSSIHSGAIDYVVKPIDELYLAFLLQRLLQRKVFSKMAQERKR